MIKFLFLTTFLFFLALAQDGSSETTSQDEALEVEDPVEAPVEDAVVDTPEVVDDTTEVDEPVDETEDDETEETEPETEPEVVAEEPVPARCIKKQLVLFGTDAIGAEFDGFQELKLIDDYERKVVTMSKITLCAEEDGDFTGLSYEISAKHAESLVDDAVPTTLTIGDVSTQCADPLVLDHFNEIYLQNLIVYKDDTQITTVVATTNRGQTVTSGTDQSGESQTETFTADTPLLAFWGYQTAGDAVNGISTYTTNVEKCEDFKVEWIAANPPPEPKVWFDSWKLALVLISIVLFVMIILLFITIFSIMKTNKWADDERLAKVTKRLEEEEQNVVAAKTPAQAGGDNRVHPRSQDTTVMEMMQTTNTGDLGRTIDNNQTIIHDQEASQGNLKRLIVNGEEQQK